MKKLILITLFLSLALVASLARGEAAWRSESFVAADDRLLFFVTGVNSISVANERPYKASMQLICTGRADVIGVTLGPITSISQQSANTKIVISGESDRTFHLYRWTVDKTFLRRDVEDAGDLIDALLVGESVRVSYTDQANTEWDVTYTLNGFAEYYQLHREACDRVRPHIND